MKIPPRLAALFSVLFWSSGALFVLGLDRLPICLLLALACSVGLFITAIYLTISGRWGLLKSYRKFILPTGALLIINQIGYVLAFKCAPAAQVDLLYYLWPSVLILLTSRFSGRYTTYLVIGCGAGGILLAFGSGSLEKGHLLGYLAAVTSALSWVLYSIMIRKHKLPNEISCINLALGAPIYWALHYLLGEQTVAISLTESATIFLYGGGVYTIAYLLWGQAVSKGSVSEAGAMSYLIPLLSITGLAIFGYIEFSPRLAVAIILVLLAATIPVIASWLQDTPKLSKNKL